MTDADQRLHDLLGGPPPPGIAALPDDVRADLAEVLHEARRRQALSLAESFDAALRHVPFPVRGIVRRIVLG